MSDDDIVYFMHNGEKVSNDPRFLAEQAAKKAKKRAKQAEALEIEDPNLTGGPMTPSGVEDSNSDSDPEGEEEDEESEEEEDEESEEGPYSDFTSKQLKAEVKARREAGREIDTSGITKKSELVAALEADDAAQAE